MLLLTKEDIASLRERLVAVSQQSALYFDKANPIMVGDESSQGGPLLGDRKRRHSK